MLYVCACASSMHARCMYTCVCACFACMHVSVCAYVWMYACMRVHVWCVYMHVCTEYLLECTLGVRKRTAHSQRGIGRELLSYALNICSNVLRCWKRTAETRREIGAEALAVRISILFIGWCSENPKSLTWLVLPFVVLPLPPCEGSGKTGSFSKTSLEMCVAYTRTSLSSYYIPTHSDCHIWKHANPHYFSSERI
jgi:hypothetical protein